AGRGERRRVTTTRIRRCGEAALLLDCADLAEAVALAGRVERLRPEAVDVVAAARTVLVTARDAAALPALRRRLEELLAQRPPHQPAPPFEPSVPPPHPSAPPPRGGTGHPDVGGAGGAVAQPPGVVTLEVRYDGPDLVAVAELAGVSTEALVRRHTAITWRAAFGGFAPGFFYLVDERELGPAPLHPEPLHPEPLPAVPRLASPRPRVPAGSVGLADRFCAVYPGASPGGWRLLGTTDAPLWDAGRPDPALLAPGIAVRFRAVRPRAEGATR
ncbi:5-oxoprolinase subunit B family protein, partial [Dietzia sp. UBA5065]|uniref:5-oxoprolinase subunit B family protein n=1 Tax=Dietzia sp. UBA5065 TaxID=1946422 RepID=UPI0025C62C35